MKLTRVERLTLANQFKILAKLDEHESGYYEQAVTILENGYELHYGDLFENVYEETLSVEESREVLDILNMFRELKISIDRLSDKSGIWMHKATFDGFDFNDSTELTLGQYAEFYCEKLDRFDEIRPSSYNSHALRLEDYREMLSRMPELEGQQLLTKEQIIAVVGKEPPR